MSSTLSARDRTRLRARAHHLEPIVRVGKAGVSEAFVSEVDRALADHELIKVRIDIDDRAERDRTADQITAHTQSAVVQRVGKIVVLWRAKPEEA